MFATFDCLSCKALQGTPHLADCKYVAQLRELNAAIEYNRERNRNEFLRRIEYERFCNASKQKTSI